MHKVTCPHRDKSYAANLPPRGPWTCALCGARLEQDDTSHKKEKLRERTN